MGLNIKFFIIAPPSGQSVDLFVRVVSEIHLLSLGAVAVTVSETQILLGHKNKEEEEKKY